jgi:hypothetical protein
MFMFNYLNIALLLLFSLPAWEHQIIGFELWPKLLIDKATRLQ